MTEPSSPSFGLGTFSDGGAPYPGIVVDGRVADLRDLLGDPSLTSTALLRDWDRSFARMQELTSSSLERTKALDQLRALPPVDPPGQIICAGANYRRHVINMESHQFRYDLDENETEEQRRDRIARSVDERAATGAPFGFAALPSALCGAYDDVVLPSDSEQHDWEIELALVIGRTARNVSRADALDHVAGYAISNDLSTRGLLYRDDVRFPDWIASKCSPTFFPTGPYIVPRPFVPDPTDLKMTLKVNGEVMQDESTSDMIFPPARLVEHFSSLVELRPGDLILTGSPAGNAGEHGGRYLRPGDVIESEIEGLGVQRNRCVAG